MSTTHRDTLDLARLGNATVTLDAAWTISDGARLVWSLTIAFTPQGARPLRAAASLNKGNSSRTIENATADDIDLVEDPDRSMLHARVRTGGKEALLATFRHDHGQWKLAYAATTALEALGLKGGRYEIEA